MKLLLFVTSLAAAALANLTPVPPGNVAATQTEAIKAIVAVMSAENEAVTDATAAFKPINDTCSERYTAAIASCKACKDRKCEERTRNVCTPRQQQSVDSSQGSGPVRIVGKVLSLGRPVGKIANTVGGAVGGAVNTVGGAVNTVGGAVSGAANSVGNVITNQIPGAVSDVAGGAVNGVINAGNAVGNFASNLAGEVSNTAGGVVNTVGDVLGSGANAVKDTFEDIGGTIGGWFGKRDDIEYSKRTAEPTCADLQRNYTQACQFYASANYCPSCIFNIDTECPRYAAAEAEYLAALAARSYRSKMKNNLVNIKKISYDGTTFDPAKGGFRRVVVEASIFGVHLPPFNVGEPINPWTPNTSGPVIGRALLEKFKSS